MKVATKGKREKKKSLDPDSRFQIAVIFQFQAILGGWKYWRLAPKINSRLQAFHTPDWISGWTLRLRTGCLSRCILIPFQIYGNASDSQAKDNSRHVL
ncbi:hypothetical protein E2C01_092231 [Portunus trituberculatus]|uniref:Uncharacterized protein n=1 Tax=Portunus trituberculatus TaxID=210409 RepID=A0A5B7JQ11_PORTR|nr:hypothetical protein [Portunus trituberculatus]